MIQNTYKVTGKRFREWGLENAFKGADWERTISFAEKKIKVEDGIVTVDYLFSDIEKIKEKGNKIWLYMNNKTVVRLYKDCFTQGDWEKCKEMISE